MAKHFLPELPREPAGHGAGCKRGSEPGAFLCWVGQASSPATGGFTGLPSPVLHFLFLLTPRAGTGGRDAARTVRLGSLTHTRRNWPAQSAQPAVKFGHPAAQFAQKAAKDGS